MRTIKFRAWHKEIKEMFQVGQITLEKGVWDYQPDNRKNIGVSIPYQPSFILMQFTGLHDKNGKEIYEGDIVELSEEGRKLYGTSNELSKKYQLVGFKDGAFMTCRNKYLIDEFDTYLWIMKNYATVVGNIYENEELLNETNR